MARPHRILYENAVYHVTSRGNERRKVFLDDQDRWGFLGILEEAVEEHKALVHAYVLMDNHFHLVVETPQKNLPSFMAHLNGVYTLRFNKRRHRAGHLFQGRYHAVHVDKGVYLKELCRYVVLNPVRAKMKGHPGQWSWSSYRATAGLEKEPKWLETRWILGQFGRSLKGAQSAYRLYVQRDMKGAKSPWETAHRGLYLGGEEFLARMQGMVQKEKNLDVPKYQKLLVKPGIPEVYARVAKVMGLELGEVMRRGRKGNEAGDIAIYLLKKEYGYGLKEIGKELGVGFSAVGNRWHRVKERMAKDLGLAKHAEKCKM